MCFDVNQTLPSFVSLEDIEDMIDFVKTLLFSQLITSMFIGLHKQVREFFFFKKFHSTKLYK